LCVPRYEATIGVEAKVIRPTLAKPQKSPNTFGISRAAGLLCSGFPYAGLIAFVDAEPSPESAYIDVIAYRVVDPEQARCELVGSTRMDPFPYDTTERHYERLVSRAPPEIAIACLGLMLQRRAAAPELRVREEIDAQGCTSPITRTALGRGHLGAALKDGPTALLSVRPEMLWTFLGLIRPPVFATATCLGWRWQGGNFGS
jgi:hypothetical protein